MHPENLNARQTTAFKGLASHPRECTDAQTIDNSNLAGFCRNHLSKRVLAASNELGGGLSYDDALEMLHGVPYAESKEKHQLRASEAQINIFEKLNRCTPI